MTKVTQSHDVCAGTIELSGFSGLNLFDFIEADIPGKCWPTKIQILSSASDGVCKAKLHFVDIDGTDPAAINHLLSEDKEPTLKSTDCLVNLQAFLGQVQDLQVILPNAARLGKR